MKTKLFLSYVILLGLFYGPFTQAEIAPKELWLEPDQVVEFQFQIDADGLYQLLFTARSHAEAAILSRIEIDAFSADEEYGFFIHQSHDQPPGRVWLPKGFYTFAIRNNSATSNLVVTELTRLDELVASTHRFREQPINQTLINLPNSGPLYTYHTLGKFTVTAGDIHLLQATHTGMDLYLMTISNYRDFQDGLPFDFIAEYSKPSVEGASTGPVILDLPDGEYAIGLINNFEELQSVSGSLTTWTLLEEPNTNLVPTQIATSGPGLSFNLSADISQYSLSGLRVFNESASNASGSWKAEVWEGASPIVNSAQPSGRLVTTVFGSSIAPNQIFYGEQILRFFELKTTSTPQYWISVILKEFDPENPGTQWPVRDVLVKEFNTYPGIRFKGAQPGKQILSKPPFDSDSSPAFANEITLPARISEEVGSSDNMDFFRIEISEPGRLVAQTSRPPVTVNGELFEARGRRLRWSDSGTWSNFRISQIVPPGTYYLRVTSKFTFFRSDQYDLEIDFYPDSGPGTSPRGRISNLSIRSLTGQGNDRLTVGFVVSGQSEKELLLRGVGPTLQNFGVESAIVDPVLEIHSSSNLIASNDDWHEVSPAQTVALESTFSRLGAFPLSQTSEDSALLLSVAPGPYTSIVEGGENPSICLIEVYDASTDPSSNNSNLVNLSTRTRTGFGNDVLTAGFVVEEGPINLLIRGVGKTLENYGVGNVIEDPRVAVFNQDRSWGVFSIDDRLGADFNKAHATQTVGAFPLTESKDDSLLITLNPGVYTAELQSMTGSAGVGLLEIYVVP